MSKTSLRITITQKGPLGIDFKNNKDAHAVCISYIHPDSLASCFKKLRIGMMLRAIESTHTGIKSHRRKKTVVAGWKTVKVTELIRHSHRPLVLHFEEPRSVVVTFEEEGKFGLTWENVVRSGFVRGRV